MPSFGKDTYMSVTKWLSRQTVIVIIGGHAQRMLRYLRAIYPKASFVLAIDAPNELSHIGRAQHNPRVKLFSLAVGHTAQTLCQGLPAHVIDYISSIGGMVASEGMGQSILIGRQAGELLVASEDFQRFVKQELVPGIRKLAGGALEEVEFLFLGSSAGATYTGAEEPIARSLTQLTREQTSAVTRADFLATGALTYEGLGDRVWPNGGAALSQLLAQVCDPHRDKREVRAARFVEFPMFGEDEVLRDACLAQVEQAARSKWFEYEQQRSRPNRSLNGRFGNIQTWEVAFGTPLDYPEDILPVIADAYVPPLAAILDRKTSVAAAESLELAHARIRLTNGAVEDIVSASVDLPAEKLIDDLKSPTYRHDVTVWVRIKANKRICLVDLPRHWAKVALTTAEIDECMQLQRRLVDLLQAELDELSHRREELEKELDDASDDFAKQHRLLQPSAASLPMASRG